MDSKIIAFSGSHGTGKTTSVYGLAERCKRAGVAGGNVGIVLETARLCPMPVFSPSCTKPTEEAQMWIFAKQLQEEAEACSRYDLVISDRTLVDCIAYTRHFGYYMLADSMEYMTHVTLSRYLQVIFRGIKENDFLQEDGFRSMDPLARPRIERIMLSTYKRLGVTLLKDSPDLGKLSASFETFEPSGI